MADKVYFFKTKELLRISNQCAKMKLLGSWMILLLFYRIHKLFFRFDCRKFGCHRRQIQFTSNVKYNLKIWFYTIQLKYFRSLFFPGRVKYQCKIWFSSIHLLHSRNEIYLPGIRNINKKYDFLVYMLYIPEANFIYLENEIWLKILNFQYTTFIFN